MAAELVLSLFPGIGLLDRGFEAAGFCVVRGPDLLWGGDVRTFRVPSDRLEGVIGGPPCQDFSVARRVEPSGEGLEMLEEYKRIVQEAKPLWWLAENVPGVPEIRICGYSWQRLDIAASDFGLKQRRLRHIQFGARDDTAVTLPRPANRGHYCAGATVCASDTQTPWSRFLEAQGLPQSFNLPAFTAVAARRGVGNAVALPVAEALGVAVRDRQPRAALRLCACGCGRELQGAQTYATGACRKRAYDRRKAKRDSKVVDRYAPAVRGDRVETRYRAPVLPSSGVAGPGRYAAGADTP